MPRQPAPYLHRGWFVSNAGGRRHKLCREKDGKGAARKALLALLAAQDAGATKRCESALPVGPGLTVAGLIDLSLQHKQGKITPHTWKQERCCLARFARRHGDRPAESITRLEAQRFVDGLVVGFASPPG